MISLGSRAEGNPLCAWQTHGEGGTHQSPGDLLYEMGESLGYHFDKVTLKKNAYYPRGWGEVEVEQHQLRKAALAVFAGEKPLNVVVVGAPLLRRN